MAVIRFIKNIVFKIKMIYGLVDLVVKMVIDGVLAR